MRTHAHIRAWLPALLRALALGGACAGAAAVHAGSAAGASVPAEILVKLRAGDGLTPLLMKYGLTLKDRFGARPIFRLGAGPLLDVRATVAALRMEPGVLLAEENAINGSPEARKNLVWAIGTPQDYQQQWAPAALHLAAAQRLSTGAGIRVAVIDTGVDASHPLLAGKVLPGYDFVDGDLDAGEVGTVNDAGFGHGTHVAGIVLTTAPDARILPLRVLDPSGMGTTWALAQAILFAIDPDGDPSTDDGAQVINLSLGTPVRTQLLDAISRLANCAALTAPGTSDPVDDVSDRGYDDDDVRCRSSRGAVVMAAAGNGGGTAKEYPAAEGASGLAAIAASTQGQQLAAFSNYGSWVTLAAPGDRITSSVPGGAYATWGGTSMATPWASGAAALLLASEPQLLPRDVVRRLADSASRLCGTALLQIDPLAALLHKDGADATCP